MHMPRAATTADAFNAVAEQRRRDLIDALSQGGNHAVGELVITLGLSQPAVSSRVKPISSAPFSTASAPALSGRSP